MGRDSDDAAASLHLLDTHFRTPAVTGPSVRRPASITAGAPLNISTVDHISETVQEAVDHVRAAAPGPLKALPPRVAGIYEWWIDSTADAAPEVQLRRDIVIERQRLEHKIRLGEHKVIRTHLCPACRTWGLHWNQNTRRADCWNRKCLDRHGMGRTWTLARLATQAVTSQKSSVRRAT